MRADRSVGVAPAGTRVGAWPHAWPMLAGSLLVLSFTPFLKNLVAISTKHPYAGHVLFVPIFAAMLFWLERRGFTRGNGNGDRAGWPLLLGALGMVAVGYQVGNLALQALAFTATIAAGLLLVCGIHGVRRAAFILTFLLLMLPPPRAAVSALAPQIQSVVAAFSAVILESLRIPVVHEGILLRLPDLTLEVAEECAGLRFTLILFVFVAAFARAVLPTATAQVLLLGAAVPVAMLANALRVAATGVGAYAIGPHVATGPLHYYIGKSFWAMAILTMIALACLLRGRVSRPIAHRSRPGQYVSQAQ